MIQGEEYQRNKLRIQQHLKDYPEFAKKIFDQEKQIQELKDTITELRWAVGALGAVMLIFGLIKFIQTL